jgi:parvulin-like peptidyl-prolyl isomerase
LKWNQLPPAWRDIVHKLDKGQTSGILRGANDRFWIVKLVDKRDSDITFDAVRDAIIEVLKNDKLEALRQKMEQELRKAARIDYANRPLLEHPSPAQLE